MFISPLEGIRYLRGWPLKASCKTVKILHEGLMLFCIWWENFLITELNLFFFALWSKAAFQLCPDHIIHSICCSWFNSWVAEVMGVNFLPKETTVAEGPDQELNLEPYNYQADALAFCYCLPTRAFLVDIVHRTEVTHLTTFVHIRIQKEQRYNGKINE